MKTTKRCPKCRKTKPLTEFYVRRQLGRPDTVRSECKPCTSKDANSPEYRAASAAKRAAARAESRKLADLVDLPTRPTSTTALPTMSELAEWYRLGCSLR